MVNPSRVNVINGLIQINYFSITSERILDNPVNAIHFKNRYCNPNYLLLVSRSFSHAS